MQISNVNDVKIYNLSCGKSIPQWLSDRKKRMLLKRDVELRRRIELIQDFEMPGMSNKVKISKDEQYIFATGMYKPRVRCYDVNELAMKFERCFDSEIVTFQVLSDDYSKLVFLQCDRYVEVHSQFGHYYRFRIPKFGRDMSYNINTCDLYFVGASSQIYRFNLEQGTFHTPLDTNYASLNVCTINPVHHLFICGSEEGNIDAWDPRTRKRVGVLDCALNSVTTNSTLNGMPSVTAVKFKDALNLAVGTATGQILMYDIRSSKPYLVKDHMYGLPIKSIEFINSLDLVASIDSKILKIWNRNSGKPYTAIQTENDLNDLCILPNTGLICMANEGKKIYTYYIPSIGPAPRWCSFLDRITEELEESNENTIYDDYKFVTENELDDLGLNNLIGTNLLRAYMHGFFIDMRLYHKAKAASNPFAYEEYRKKKIKEKIQAERANRVQIKSRLPKVNRELAQRLMVEEENEKIMKSQSSNLLKDDRFKNLFDNPDFQIDEKSQEYRQLHRGLKK